MPRTTQLKSRDPRKATKVRKVKLTKENAKAINAAYTIYVRYGEYNKSMKNRFRLAVHNDVKAALLELDDVKGYYYKSRIDSIMHDHSEVTLHVVNNYRQAKQFLQWKPKPTKGFGNGRTNW